MTGRNQSYSVGNTSPDNDQDVEVRCGYGQCRPAFLEKINNSKTMLAIMSFYVFAQGFVINGLFNVSVSSIERRFQFKSTDMGLVAAAYDFSAAAFGIIICYLGAGRHKAKWLTVSTIFMIAGSVMGVLPHFTTGLYDWGDTVSKVCDYTGSEANGTSMACEPSSLQRYIGLFAASMLMYGVGGATIYTIGTAYIDDSVSALYSPTYMGIFFGFAALGPGLGFVVGGLLLNIYVDVDQVDTSNLDIDSNDVRWVGAWWLGQLASIVVFVLAGLALTCFGAELPSAKEVRETRESQLHNGSSTRPQDKIPSRPEVGEVPRVLVELVKNPPFLFTTLAGITESAVVSGMSTFTAKFVQNAYNIPAGNAGILAGVPIVIGLAGGISFGGFFCRCLKLKVAGMLKFCFSTCLISAFCAALMFATCDQKQISGVQTPYLNSTGDPTLMADCNAGCSCTTEFYVASCDQDGGQFFSPCHAGCHVSLDNDKTFANCSCIANQTSSVSMVTTGSCETKCSLMYVFLVLLFLLCFTSLAADIPAEQAVLRSIDENHRAIMCGANRFFIRLLGTVPGAVIFGAATDAGCLTWKQDCGENTSCWIYDISVVSRNYFLLIIIPKLFSLTFFFCALWFYKPPKDENPDIDICVSSQADKIDPTFHNKSFDKSESL